MSDEKRRWIDGHLWVRVDDLHGSLLDRIRDLEVEIAGLLKSRNGISDFRDAVMKERDEALARVALLEAEIKAQKAARLDDLRRAGIHL